MVKRRGGESSGAYARIVGKIFLDRYRSRATKVAFDRDDIVQAARSLGITNPKNLGDVVYSIRYRQDLPKSINDKAPKGLQWIIRPKGKSRYAFEAVKFKYIEPSEVLAQTKIPDATPGVISKYALSDEQALLAKLRYNRLIDIFSGVACYSLQSHLRSSVAGIGQVETDELYVGVDRRGAHFVFPVQAKGGRDLLSVVQIEQDLALCKEKFPSLICRPIAAQFMKDDVIALFELELQGDEVAVSYEKHYRLVPEDEVSPEDLRAYASRKR